MPFSTAQDSGPCLYCCNLCLSVLTKVFQRKKFVIGLAKMAIYISRRNKVIHPRRSDAISVFSVLVKSRIYIDSHFYNLIQDLGTFGALTKLCVPFPQTNLTTHPSPLSITSVCLFVYLFYSSRPHGFFFTCKMILKKTHLYQ